MTPPRTSTSAEAEALLAHAGWVRALARSLVRDPHAADDLVQRTWLAALEHGPREAAPTRSWLATVLRNAARQERRGGSRRSQREDAVRRADETASTFDVVARAGRQRELVEAVLALDEPYRTTVLLRFFDGLPPRAIAQRQSVPVATVKTRLARGLQHLRRRLEEEQGGERGAWLAVALPLAVLPPTLTPTAIGALLVDTKLKLALAGLVLVGAVSGLAMLRSDARPVEVTAVEAVERAAPEPVAASSPSSAPAAAAGESAREVMSAVAAATREEPPRTEPAPAARLRGLVLDAEGLPLAGVALALVPPGELQRTSLAAEQLARAREPLGRSGAGGRFDLEAPGSAGLVVAAEPARATVLAGRHREGAEGPEPVVVVARRAPLAGRVTEERGAPVAGARVDWKLPEDFRARFAAVLDDSVAPTWSAEADEQGFFELPAAASVRGALLQARAEGYEAWSASAPELADAALEVVLRRPGAETAMVAGRVVDPRGEPVEGARVALGLETVSTDSRGLFAFDVASKDSLGARVGAARDRLVAVKRGYLPAALNAAEGEQPWPAAIVLRLGAEPLALAGRVVHQDGRPAEGASVWVADPQLLGAVDGRPVLLEGLLAGAEGELWRRVATDADGRFRIDGLDERAYRVEAMDPATLLRTSIDAVEAGAARLELVLPDDQLFERVAGRVVSRRGAPVEGVSVFPMCDAFTLRHEGRTLGTSHATVEGTRTDADGRFELRGVPETLVYLRLNGDRTLPVEYGRHVEGGLAELAEGRLEELRIVVPLRCHLKVELSADHPADAVAVLDEHGERLTLNVIEGTMRREDDVLALSAGQSPPLAVSDAATTLVLLRAGAELERRPLALSPDELNVVGD